MADEINLLLNSVADLKWFNENSKKLNEEYEGEIIAIKDKKVVARAPNSDIIFKKLKEKKIDDSDVLIKGISPRNIITIL